MQIDQLRHVVISLLLFASTASAAELEEALLTVRQASATSGTPDEIRAAWTTVASADAEAMPAILRSMKGSNLAAENWLRAAADAIAQQTVAAGKSLPQAELVALVEDTTASPRGRRVAYEWLEKTDAATAGKLLADMLNDPSLELRYDAVAQALDAADARANKSSNLMPLNKLLRSARDLEQIKSIKAQLEELGQVIDLAKLMGFVTEWRVIGPFDNTDKAGFDVAYPPESEVDFAAKYAGKEGDIEWKPDQVVTDDELGKVDVADAEVLGPLKGAVAYAYSEFESPDARTAVVRYSSPNATKLWVNGQLVADNEVYHAGGAFDQYVAAVQLKAGKNAILLKVCQNEQTEPWAQDWTYQLRVTDELAGAIPRAASD